MQLSVPHDQRTASTYIFGAICPGDGKGAALVLSACNTEAMNLHLAEIAAEVAPGKHAVLVVDQAGAPARMRSIGTFRDRLPVDRGRPRQVAERHLAPERRVGTRKKLVPQLRLGLKHPLGRSRGDRLSRGLDAQYLCEPPADPLRRRGAN